MLQAQRGQNPRRHSETPTCRVGRPWDLHLSSITCSPVRLRPEEMIFSPLVKLDHLSPGISGEAASQQGPGLPGKSGAARRNTNGQL